MAAMDTDEAKRVAVLHDVVEDCGVTLDDLRALGYPEREVMAIDALTKREDEQDDYPRFIEHVLGCEDGAPRDQRAYRSCTPPR
jgi:hypothetical protein